MKKKDKKNSKMSDMFLTFHNMRYIWGYSTAFLTGGYSEDTGYSYSQIIAEAQLNKDTKTTGVLKVLKENYAEAFEFLKEFMWIFTTEGPLDLATLDYIIGRGEGRRANRSDLSIEEKEVLQESYDRLQNLNYPFLMEHSGFLNRVLVEAEHKYNNPQGTEISLRFWNGAAEMAKVFTENKLRYMQLSHMTFEELVRNLRLLSDSCTPQKTYKISDLSKASPEKMQMLADIRRRDHSTGLSKADMRDIARNAVASAHEFVCGKDTLTKCANNKEYIDGFLMGYVSALVFGEPIYGGSIERLVDNYACVELMRNTPLIGDDNLYKLLITGIGSGEGRCPATVHLMTDDALMGCIREYMPSININAPDLPDKVSELLAILLAEELGFGTSADTRKQLAAFVSNLQKCERHTLQMKQEQEDRKGEAEETEGVKEERGAEETNKGSETEVRDEQDVYSAIPASELKQLSREQIMQAMSVLIGLYPELSVHDIEFVYEESKRKGEGNSADKGQNQQSD